MLEGSRRAFDDWLGSRVGGGYLSGGPDGAGSDSVEWSIEFGSGSKYLRVTDAVLLDPYLTRLATMRLERSGWLDEPGTEELTITESWARAGRPEFTWIHPEEGVTHAVTFWGARYGDRDRVTLTAPSEDGEARTYVVVPANAPTVPPVGDPELDEKMVRIMEGSGRGRGEGKDGGPGAS